MVGAERLNFLLFIEQKAFTTLLTAWMFWIVDVKNKLSWPETAKFVSLKEGLQNYFIKLLHQISNEILVFHSLCGTFWDSERFMPTRIRLLTASPKLWTFKWTFRDQILLFSSAETLTIHLKLFHQKRVENIINSL